MTRSLSLANRLREVLLNGHWIANTNFMELIQSVNSSQATEKISDLNTIAALTFHINYYLVGIMNVFKGGKLEIRDKYSFDLPAIQSEADWDKMRVEFQRNAEEFIRHVEKIPDSLLDEPFVDEKYGSYLRNIEGVIEHSYYHLGQVSLLKKMVAKSE